MLRGLMQYPGAASLCVQSVDIVLTSLGLVEDNYDSSVVDKNGYTTHIVILIWE